MSLALRTYWLSLCLCGAALPRAAAQPSAPQPSAARVVLLTGSRLEEEDFSVLQGALAKLQAELVQVSSEAPACEPGVARVEPGVRVWVSWQPDQPVRLCFEDRSGRHARTLGPFAALRGSAREQLMTVIESGLQAAEAAEAELSTPAAPAPPSAAVPPPAAHVVPDPDTHFGFRPALGFEVVSWSSRALATRFDAALGVSWSERAPELRAELGLTPSFSVDSASHELAVDARSWRLGLSANHVVPLYERFGALIGAGAALEYVHVKPDASAHNVSSKHAVSHTDPVLFARVGPTIELGAKLRLSILAGAELLLQPRRYGFTVGDSREAALDLARVRASVLAEISAAL